MEKTNEQEAIQQYSSEQAATVAAFWNERYAEGEYMYGKEPNKIFKAFIDAQPQPGTALFAGAGEGRDAVYAAGKGWDVHCVDLSEQGRNKALALADEKGVKLGYLVSDITKAAYPDAAFDIIVSVFFHLPDVPRKHFYASAKKWLKPGGLLLLVAYTPEQLNYDSGGPRDVGMLVAADTLEQDLAGLETLHLETMVTMLAEGTKHVGESAIVTYTGRKP